MSSSCCNFLNIPGPIRITVDTCHFLSVALFMEYSLTIKWQPASLDKLMDTFPPFFASTEERLEERVITHSLIYSSNFKKIKFFQRFTYESTFKKIEQNVTNPTIFNRFYDEI